MSKSSGSQQESATEIARYQELVDRVLSGSAPPDHELDTCRAAVCAAVAADDRQTAMQALCMLLEGALADPGLAIDDTQVVVPLLKALARGRVQPAEVVDITSFQVGRDDARQSGPATSDRQSSKESELP